MTGVRFRRPIALSCKVYCASSDGLIGAVFARVRFPDGRLASEHCAIAGHKTALPSVTLAADSTGKAAGTGVF